MPVEHRRFDGQMHGFFTMVDVLGAAATSPARVAEQVDPHVAGSSTRLTEAGRHHAVPGRIARSETAATRSRRRAYEGFRLTPA